jgi:hypothetical protein
MGLVVLRIQPLQFFVKRKYPSVDSMGVLRKDREECLPQSRAERFLTPTNHICAITLLVPYVGMLPFDLIEYI